jgi:hypothetical protein
MTRHTYTTTLSSGTDGEADYIEMEATFSFTYLPGHPETRPAYDHGGLPAEPPLIEDVELALIDGKTRPWLQFPTDLEAGGWAETGLDAAYDHHIAEMLAIAEEDRADDR